MNLTLRQRDRLDHLIEFQELRHGKQHDARFLATLFILILAGFVLLWIACRLEWQPGEQEKIYREYKANRHEAINVAVL